jgi:hypothetical protein
MKQIRVAYQGTGLDLESASRLAKEVARENQMQDPTVMSWHQCIHPEIPYYEGADPDTWWEKYGSGNGGQLEVCLGDAFQFVLMDTRGYEQLGEIPLRNLADGLGNQFLCYTPLLGKFTAEPTIEACTHLDGWAADQY